MKNYKLLFTLFFALILSGSLLAEKAIFVPLNSYSNLKSGSSQIMLVSSSNGASAVAFATNATNSDGQNVTTVNVSTCYTNYRNAGAYKDTLLVDLSNSSYERTVWTLTGNTGTGSLIDCNGRYLGSPGSSSYSSNYVRTYNTKSAYCSTIKVPATSGNIETTNYYNSSYKYYSTSYTYWYSTTQTYKTYIRANAYSVSFDAGSYGTTSGIPSVNINPYVITLPSFTFNDPSYSTYAQFDGWGIIDPDTGDTTVVGDAGDPYSVTADGIVLSALVSFKSPYPYTYTFDAGMQGVCDTTVYKGFLPCILPQVDAMDGWTFVGWTSGTDVILAQAGSIYPTSGMMTKDLTFKAKYTEVFTVLGWIMNTSNSGIYKAAVVDTVIIQFTKQAHSVTVTPYTATLSAGTATTTELKKAGVYVDTCIYKIPVTADILQNTNYKSGRLLLTFWNSAMEEVTHGYIRIPAIVFPTAATTAGTELVLTNSSFTSTGVGGSYCVLNSKSDTADLVLVPGKNGLKVTIDRDYTFRNVYVYGGTRLDIVQGVVVNVRGNIFLRSGDITGTRLTSLKYKYCYPQLCVEGTIRFPNGGKIYYDMFADTLQWRNFSVPYDVPVNTVTYWNGDSARMPLNFMLQDYNGARRALFTQSWVDNDSTAWFLDTTSAVIKGGHGYIIEAAPQLVRSDYTGSTEQYQAYAMLRFPLTGGLAKGEIARSRSVYAVPHPSSTATIHAGWNILGNPYLANFGGKAPTTKNYTGSAASNTVAYASNGPVLTKTGDYVTQQQYVVMPSDDGQSYTAYVASTKPLPAFKNFFVQIAADVDSMTFPLVTTRKNMPYYAMEEQSEDIRCGVVMTSANGAETDRVGVVIGETYTDEYEINADLAKWENKGMNFYALKQNDKLAFIAVNAEKAAEKVPLGMTLRTTMKNMVIALDSEYDTGDFEHIYLVDVTKNQTVDLLSSSYTCSSTIGDFTQRFYLRIALKQKTPTAVMPLLDNAGASEGKYLIDGQLVIIKDGKAYNAQGMWLK